MNKKLCKNCNHRKDDHDRKGCQVLVSAFDKSLCDCGAFLPQESALKTDPRECARCGCRADTHPIPTCKEFVLPQIPPPPDIEAYIKIEKLPILPIYDAPYHLIVLKEKVNEIIDYLNGKRN